MSPGTGMGEGWNSGALAPMPSPPRGVGAPGHHGAAPPQCQGVELSGRDAHDVREPGHGRGPDTPPAGPMAHLSVGAVAPGPHAAILAHGEGVPRPGRQGRDEGGGEVRHLRGRPELPFPLEAKLRGGVVTPAPHAAIRAHGQPVRRVGGDGDHVREPGNEGRGEPWTSIGIAQPQLPVHVVPPGPDAAIRSQRQAVVATRRHGNDSRQWGHLDRADARHARAISHLANEIQSPRPDGSILGQRQAMALSRRERISGMRICFPLEVIRLEVLTRRLIDGDVSTLADGLSLVACQQPGEWPPARGRYSLWPRMRT